MNPRIATISLLLALAAKAQANPVTRVQHLMGAFCEIKAEASDKHVTNQAITAAFQEISRLEAILSSYQPTSEVSQLNRLGQPTIHKCSPEFFAILKESLAFSKATHGTFDITGRSSGYRQIELNENDQTASFKGVGFNLDFGGIGKGFALDRAAQVLKQNGVTNAQLNFSGQILVFGQPGNMQPIVLADPNNSQKSVVTIHLEEGSVSTSSQLERKNHIIDPHTGQPAPFQGSVTVISPNATAADALSTALVVLGPEKGVELIQTKFTESEVLYLVPEKSGWTQVTSPNFDRFKNKSN